jgi:hypothetical protein
MGLTLMDQRTIKFYDENAEEIFWRYETAQSPISTYLFQK